MTPDREHEIDDAWSRLVHVIDAPGKPVSPEAFHEARPDIWPTPGDAAHDIEASGIELYTEEPRYPSPEGPAVHVSWRARNGRPRHAWLWPSCGIFTDGANVIVGVPGTVSSEIMARPEIAELIEAATAGHA